MKARWVPALLGLGAVLLIGFGSAPSASAQLGNDALLTVACGKQVVRLRPTGVVPDPQAASLAALPEARQAAANVVASRLTALATFPETRPSPEALEALADGGETAECDRAVQRALIKVYSRSPDVLSDPTTVLPDPDRTLTVNVARATAIYFHAKCSSEFRLGDPREIIATHVAIARGTGQVKCTFTTAVEEGDQEEEVQRTIVATGSEAWWRAVFGDQLSGLWGTFGPFLSRDQGGANAFTLFGDRVCDELQDLAVNDPNALIRQEAAEAYFSPLPAQRVRRGTIVNVAFLCPEGLTGEGAPLAGASGGLIDPVERLKLTVSGGSEVLRRQAAFAAAKALAELATPSPFERVLGVGVISPQGERELQETLAGVRFGSGPVSVEAALDLITVRADTPEARLAGALALGLTWEDRLKAGEGSRVLGAIDRDSLVAYWFSSDVRAPSAQESVWEARKAAVVAPLARLFAAKGEEIRNFTVGGQGITGLPDLKP